MARMTGAALLLGLIEQHGVEVVFGIPGGAALPLYDALVDSNLRHVLMRHEQGAGHAAEGYAHATGRPGVCFVTSGPGGCNLVTPLADAMMDSVPLVAISGQVPSARLGTDAFQETPITAVTAPVTKKSWLVSDVADLPRVIAEAFRVATSGRPGPVLVDVPKDMLAAETDVVVQRPAPPQRLPSRVDRSVLEEAVGLILRSSRPVAYVGGGVVKAGAAAELATLVRLAHLPVTTTLMARGAFPDSDPLSLGMPGMHGSFPAVRAMQEADLLVAVGARFDDRVTGRLDGFAPHARVIHLDVDATEIGKNRPVDVGIVGDARVALHGLSALFGARAAATGWKPNRAWLAHLAELKARYPFRYDRHGALKPQFVIERLCEATAGDAIVVAGVGQHQMWTSQLWRFERPRRWINSGGLGTMGFAIPAAIGAKLARPDERVIAIDGDGCFQMTCQELATAADEGIGIVVAILNNRQLGMVRQWQEMFHGGRFSNVRYTEAVPDYVKLAEAYGCVGLRAQTRAEVDDVVAEALAVRNRPVVVDFRVDPTENCYPIVPAGATNDEIILGPAYETEEAVS